MKKSLTAIFIAFSLSGTAAAEEYSYKPVPPTSEQRELDTAIKTKRLYDARSILEAGTFPSVQALTSAIENSFSEHGEDLLENRIASLVMDYAEATMSREDMTRTLYAVAGKCSDRYIRRLLEAGADPNATFDSVRPRHSMALPLGTATNDHNNDAYRQLCLQTVDAYLDNGADPTLLSPEHTGGGFGPEQQQLLNVILARRTLTPRAE